MEICGIIDNVQDLDIAESLFAENDKITYQLLAMRYGGYWTYPKLLDFCYLVNPHYPAFSVFKSQSIRKRGDMNCS